MHLQVLLITVPSTLITIKISGGFIMGMVSEFKEFVMKGNMMDMATGIIIGAAVSAVVGSLVDDLIMPIIGLFTGGVDFSGSRNTLR